MCLVVVVVIAICMVISLSIISRSTRQTNEALESAITAYDLYLQGLGGEVSRTEGILEKLDGDGLLDGLADDADHVAADSAGDALATLDLSEVDRTTLASRIAAYEESARADDVQARLYVYFPQVDRMIGSVSNGADPRDSSDGKAYDPRLLQIDASLLVEGSGDVSFIVELDGDMWHTEVGALTAGVRYVMLLSMPELPSTEILTPISDVCEMYFADRYGHKYAYSESPRFADVFEFDDLQTSDLQTGDEASSGFVTVEHDGEKYRCYYEDNCAGYNKFVLVTRDVVDAARREFVGATLLAGVLLVLGGCLVGFLLTRHVYEPLQHIIDRLTPPGRRVDDEFRLIGFALDGMERSLAEQREVIADLGMMRLLRDSSEDALDKGRGALGDSSAVVGASNGEAPFYLQEGTSCALAIVRVDRTLAAGGAAAAASVETLRPVVEEYLAGKVVSHAACVEGQLLFVVLDAHDLDVPALAAGLLGCLEDAGILASVFTSSTYSGPTMLNACYREAVRVMEQGELEHAFNRAMGPESLPDGDARAHPALGELGLFDDMCAYIQGNYRDPSLSSGQLARRFGMSQASVTRLFKQRTNGSFLDYVHNLRIQEAESLLVSTELSVAEVAARVGYGDASTMTRAFRRYRGKTPGECRRG